MTQCICCLETCLQQRFEGSTQDDEGNEAYDVRFEQVIRLSEGTFLLEFAHALEHPLHPQRSAP